MLLPSHATTLYHLKTATQWISGKIWAMGEFQRNLGSSL